MTQRERERLVALHKADKRLITQKQAKSRPPSKSASANGK